MVLRGAWGVNVGVGVGVPIAVAMAIASGRAQQPTPRPHPADEVPHGAGSVVVLDPGLKELTHGGLLLLGLPWRPAAMAGCVSGRCQIAGIGFTSTPRTNSWK